MVLQSFRDPDTPCSVWAEYIESLGAKRAAHFIGRSTTTGVYSSANENEDYLIDGSRHYRVLDLECARKDKGLPYANFHIRTIANQLAGEGSKPVETVALELIAAKGLLADAIVQARDPNSPGGRQIVEEERRRLHDLRRGVQVALDALGRAIDGDTSRSPDNIVTDFLKRATG
ncbi:MAG: hypothetical protein ACR2RF_24915 [Geminicoccaceae bacterium]